MSTSDPFRLLCESFGLGLNISNEHWESLISALEEDGLLERKVEPPDEGRSISYIGEILEQFLAAHNSTSDSYSNNHVRSSAHELPPVGPEKFAFFATSNLFSNNYAKNLADVLPRVRLGESVYLPASDSSWNSYVTSSDDKLGERYSHLPPELQEKVAAHLLSPRQLFCVSPQNQLMLNEHLINANQSPGFLVNSMLKKGVVWKNEDLYFDSKCNLVQLMEHDDGYTKLLGTSNGIVLFLKDEKFVVINPITLMKRNFPQPILEFDPDNHELYDFHYLESKKEYVLLRIVQQREESYQTKMEMYSSSTNSWKVIEPPLPCMEGQGDLSFQVKSGSSLPLYHVGYPVKMDDRFYYVAADPQHSYYVALLAFDMKDYAFHIVKIFPRKVYPTSYDVQLGVYRDRVLALLITNVDTGEQLLTTFDNESSVECLCTGVSLLPKLLTERVEEIGAVVKKVFPFTDSLHAVTLKIPY